MDKIPKAEQQRRAISQKLDKILSILGYKVENCYDCDDGIRTCGYDEEELLCYQCKGSTIRIEQDGNDHNRVCRLRTQCDDY